MLAASLWRPIEERGMWSLERWRAGLNRAEFDCGEELLNLWLREQAGSALDEP